jgi:hypothetical protein
MEFERRKEGRVVIQHDGQLLVGDMTGEVEVAAGDSELVPIPAGYRAMVAAFPSGTAPVGTVGVSFSGEARVKAGTHRTVPWSLGDVTEAVNGVTDAGATALEFAVTGDPGDVVVFEVILSSYGLK